ncbi:hypothetical protein [Dactylosporangium sp. NPDC050588]|uniref:hypothetical protein n=1 Tax=Dactylosporangium sp. NPDC050588 TaxID=3157211 RepID=UPI0033D7B749
MLRRAAAAVLLQQDAAGLGVLAGFTVRTAPDGARTLAEVRPSSRTCCCWTSSCRG